MSLFRAGLRLINTAPNVKPYFTNLAAEYEGYFHEMHKKPGLAFNEATEKAIITAKLSSLGIQFNALSGGIVATILGRDNGRCDRVVGLSAEMDALPIHENPIGKGVSSEIEGVAHLCGHDGHSVSLLLAAQCLHETRNFDGTARIIWRPAEETGQGAKSMLDAGLLSDYPIDEIYAYHNFPNFPLGFGAVSAGPVLCGSRDFKITISGKDGHAGWQDVPKGQQALYRMSEFLKAHWDDAKKWGAPFIHSGQSIKEGRVLMNVSGMQTNSQAPNVLSSQAVAMGTMRALREDDFETARIRLHQIWDSLNLSNDMGFAFEFIGMSVPPLINSDDQCDAAALAMRQALGRFGKVHSIPQVTGTDDFSFLSNEVPGAYFALMGGDDNLDHPHSQKLHTAGYIYNKDLIPVAANILCNIVENRLPMAQP